MTKKLTVREIKERQKDQIRKSIGEDHLEYHTNKPYTFKCKDCYYEVAEDTCAIYVVGKSKEYSTEEEVLWGLKTLFKKEIDLTLGHEKLCEKKLEKLTQETLEAPYMYWGVGDCDSYKKYWLFDGEYTEEQVLNLLEKDGYEIDGIEIDSSYDCTGQIFASPISVKRLTNFVLASQCLGRDV